MQRRCRGSPRDVAGRWARFAAAAFAASLSALEAATWPQLRVLPQVTHKVMLNATSQPHGDKTLQFMQSQRCLGMQEMVHTCPAGPLLPQASAAWGAPIAQGCAGWPLQGRASAQAWGQACYMLPLLQLQHTNQLREFDALPGMCQASSQVVKQYRNRWHF